MSMGRVWIKEVPPDPKNGDLKCIHCGESIGFFLSRVIYREDGKEERIHSDSIMEKDCLTAAGMNDSINRISEYLLALTKSQYMAR